MTNAKLLQLKSELETELIVNILPFWEIKMNDHENGGFYGRIDGNGITHYKADKGCVLNARILWTFSSAYRIFQKQEYFETAKRAKDYILQYFMDVAYGGAYWSLNYKGNIADGKKQIYAQAFVLYGMVEYYRATGDNESLNKAIELYAIIEKYSFDKSQGGYFEAFSCDWGEIGDLRLSDKDANEKKTMNTHLHVLEAYTNLYRVYKDDSLKLQLRKLILLFVEKIINQQSYHLNMFFDENWIDKTDLISYGHDIESSWLIYEAALVLGEDAIIQKVKNIVPKIADAAQEGLQPDGSLIYEKFFAGERLDTDRHWWVNCEAVIGFLNVFQITGNTDYLDKSVAAWNFIRENIVDPIHGEWLWSVDKDLKPNRKDDKAGFWKCPYHNARMCFEIMERTESNKYNSLFHAQDK